MKKVFISSFFICILLLSQLWAFDSNYSDDNIAGSPVFRKARFYYENQIHDKTIEELNNIISQYPGTAYAAEAQLGLIDVYSMMRPPQPAKIKTEYIKLMQLYPNTRYELIGKLYTTGYGCTSNEDWWNKINALVVEYGGKSVFDILKDKKQNEYNTLIIAPQYRETIPEIYLEMASELEDEHRNADAFKIWCFLQENFPKYKSADMKYDIVEYILNNHNIQDYSQYIEDTTPPQITIDSPHHGNRVHGLKPRIQVALQDGDIMAAQVNLSKLVFTLDGEDVTDKMKVHSAINTSAQPGVIFEKIKIVYKPESPLAVGSHTVYVKAEDYGGRAGEKTWTFTIVKPSLYRDGDDEDN